MEQQQQQQQQEDDITPSSLYSTLGVASHASKAEIRSAYRKLAMKWHPDKCCNGEAAETQLNFKLKFQEIQEAYAVLSNEKKKVLYDFGLYDPDDDEKECESMGDFMGEMSALMATITTSPEDEKPTTLEDLQGIFTSIFSADVGRKRCDRADQGCSSKSSQTTNCNVSQIHEEGDQKDSNDSSSFSQPMKRNKITTNTRAAEDDAWYSRFWEAV